MSVQEAPEMRQYIVTVPAEVLGSDRDVQVLISDWDDGTLEADVRSPAGGAEPWRPVDTVGGKVERA